MVSELYDSIDYAMTISILKTKVKIIEKSNPWWTQDLHRQRQKLDTLYKHKKKGNNILIQLQNITPLEMNSKRTWKSEETIRGELQGKHWVNGRNGQV